MFNIYLLMVGFGGVEYRPGHETQPLLCSLAFQPLSIYCLMTGDSTSQNGRLLLVVATGSRGALADIQAAFPRVEVILIKAKSDTLRARLEARG